MLGHTEEKENQLYKQLLPILCNPAQELLILNGKVIPDQVGDAVPDFLPVSNLIM